MSQVNEPQREAILHEEGPLLVVAGAGSGKTRVITRRIAHLIRLGHHPSTILGLTFTNKAAGEMRDRVAKLVGTDAVFLSTFHSMGARFLRMDGEQIGVPSNYTIYDADDQKALVKTLLKEANLDSTHFRPASVLEEISRLKTAEVSPDEAACSSYYFRRQVAGIYAGYRERLKESRALDFDDLLLETLRLFRESEEALRRYQDRFRFILIDEYQDTNLIQYELAKALAGPSMNLCATGDPDQSIYTWRGASIRNILEFEKDFPGARIVKLEQNYRSSGNILKAADALIANNCQRKERTLWTDAPDGETLNLYAALGESDEAEYVVKEIVQRRMRGASFSEMALFYRTNALSRSFERALSLSNIPYTIVGGVEFYERREIKDLMAYLKLIDNPRDSVAFFRIVNTPPRAIGQRTIDQVHEIARPAGDAPLKALRRICDESLLKGRQLSALANFRALYDDLASLPRESVEGVLRAVIEKTGYEHYLTLSDAPGAAERIENVNELIAAAAEYDRQNPEGSLHGFLEETALIRGIDHWGDDADDRVPLMTLHTAKGLEFDHVFLVGLEDGLLPHMLTMDDPNQMEEERRLFYVGITRARQKVYITRSASRVRAGRMAASPPSRFLRELPRDVVEDVSHYRLACRDAWDRGESAPSPTLGAENGESVLEYDEDVAPHFERGDRVVHPYFGSGEVLKVTGRGMSARVNVLFDSLGNKQLLVKYAKLKKVL